MKCRNCKHDLDIKFVDLNTAPLSNAYLDKLDLNNSEKWLPLRVMLCDSCYLVQTEDFADASEIFNQDYAYFSSYSSTMVSHAEEFFSEVISRFNLSSKSFVIEVAANDGYLLQFSKFHKIPCLGIEPTSSTCVEAKKKGIDVIQDFFSIKLARSLVSKGIKADLIIANNVLAHVPDINDFVSAFAIVLKNDGIASFEFPHIVNLTNKNQFDTIYHEHFSYFSLNVVKNIFRNNNLEIFDVEEIKTHGGSLRVYAQLITLGKHKVSENVSRVIGAELNLGIYSLNYYTNMQVKINSIKNELLIFLISAKKEGKRTIAYGAAAKGNTLLNYCGIKSDLLEVVIDKNLSKQNKFLPGSRIPIVDESFIAKFKPDFILVLPWNLIEEIDVQLSYVKDWGCKLVTAIPRLSFYG